MYSVQEMIWCQEVDDMRIKIYKFERSKIPVGKWEIEVDDSEVVNLISKLVRMLYEGNR